MARTAPGESASAACQCLEDWATSSGPTEGFNLLINSGLSELTGEYLVIKYADRFSESAVAAAKARLEKA
jgi:hypothetical protein